MAVEVPTVHRSVDRPSRVLKASGGLFHWSTQGVLLRIPSYVFLQLVCATIPMQPSVPFYIRTLSAHCSHMYGLLADPYWLQ